MIEHKHLLIRATISNPISDTEVITTWIRNLIDTIQMKVLHGPVSVYCDKTGNRGVTGFALIETSHIALHSWDETDPATLQLDVYTCSELKIEQVFDALSIFKPITLDYKFLDRETGFTDITDSTKNIVTQWVSRIRQPNPNLGGNRICPFARIPDTVTVGKLSLNDFMSLSDNVTVYMETGIQSTYDELENLCKTLKASNPDFVFLPDHPHKKSFINGQETGNGVFPCIIVQTKQELETGRAKLEKTDYYSYWDKDYLDEIKGLS